MLNRIFTILQSYANASAETFSERAGLTTERLAQLRSCENTESRIITFQEIADMSRAMDLRFQDVIRLNERLRFPALPSAMPENTPPLIDKILTDYRDAYHELLSKPVFAGPEPILDAFLLALPSGQTLHCDTPQILYLDDRRVPQDTLSEQKIANSSVLLVRRLIEFHKVLRAGYIPNEVHFDGILERGERGVHAVEELAHAIVDGTIPLSTSVYFHSSDPSENEKMAKVFFGILRLSNLQHHQETPAPQTRPVTSPKPVSGLRAQIERQKNKGKR